MHCTALSRQNQYLVGCKHTKSAAFIDSGEVPAVFFAGYAQQQGLRVEHLVQTHAHIDHVLGLKATKKHFPLAPLYMHELDLPTYALVEKSAKSYNIPIELPLPKIDIFLGQSLTIGKLQFDVLFTPGHAPGHCVFCLLEGILFCLCRRSHLSGLHWAHRPAQLQPQSDAEVDPATREDAARPVLAAARSRGSHQHPGGKSA